MACSALLLNGVLELLEIPKEEWGDYIDKLLK